MKKTFKKVLLIFFSLIVALLIGLVVNNRVFYSKYANVDTHQESLSEEDSKRIHNIYDYLSNEGENILPGFNGNNMGLLIYNEAYEFLYCNTQPSGSEWTYIGKDTYLDKLIYRRIAENSQAFAVKVDTTWVGSFATMDTYHKKMLQEIPIFFPPQLISVDEQYYMAFVIHEMTHAYQGLYNADRVDRAEHIHNVCSTYYEDGIFQELIVKEAEYLEQAIHSNDSESVKNNILAFLQIRNTRREECRMTEQEILDEQEMEWLEGLARYSEYKVSGNSSSLIAKGLINISEKVKVKNDDRYYALGMAEYMAIIKLDIEYEYNILLVNDSLENILGELCSQASK